MYCQNCGAQIRDSASFCPNCGQKIAGNQMDAQNKGNTRALGNPRMEFPDEKKTTTAKKGKRLPLIVAGLVVLGGILALFLFAHARRTGGKQIDYGDLDHVIKPQMYSATENNKLAVGDIVTFGIYEQDNDLSNGKEDIEWIVLETRGQFALITSVYGLDCKRYDENVENEEAATWGSCDLRRWLNEDFFEEAFSESDQKSIATVYVETPDFFFNEYSDDANNIEETIERVFLLSSMEVKKYFDVTTESEHVGADSEARCFELTPYAKGINESRRLHDAEEITKEGETICNWWLRTPALSDGRAGYVGWIGGDFGMNYYYQVKRYAVRPALWVDVNVFQK